MAGGRLRALGERLRGVDRRRALGVALYAAVSFLAFPQAFRGGVVDLGLGLGWIAPAILVVTLHGLPPREAARWAGVATWAAHTTILHWIYTVTYGHAPAIVGWVAPAGAALYATLFGVGFGWANAWSRRVAALAPFATAAVWTAAEHARSFVFTGFPWAAIGYTQHENPGLVPWAAFGGVHALTFTTVLGAAALADVVVAARNHGVAGLPRGVPRRAWAAAAVVVALHAGGLVLPAPETPDSARRIRVAALQGNIEQGVKWSPDWAARTLEVYEELAVEAAEQGAELLLWPETAAPGAPEANADLRERLSGIARRAGVPMVVGSIGIAVRPESDDVLFFDSAFVMDADGAMIDRYDKSHLVPFGEYVPFRDALGGLMSAVARGLALHDVSAGAGPRAIDLPLADGSVSRVGIPICYELIFPDLVRRFVGDGGGLLLGITNDAWYGRSGAPHQFLAMSALRSAETGVWSVRAANTGVSAVIDARGRVRRQSAIFERDVVMGDVPVGAGGRPTFYVRHGNLLASTCWAIGAILCAAAWIARRGSAGNHGGEQGAS